VESTITFDNCNSWLIVWLCGSLSKFYMSLLICYFNSYRER